MSTLAAVLVAALVSCSGCWAPPVASDRDKAGGRPAADPVELRLVNTRGREAGPFLDAVSRLSAGSIRLTSTEEKFERGVLSNETDALRAVRTGEADIAVVPTRALEFVGVHSFDALMDPLLIDSMALQEQVLGDPITAQMLAGVRSAGLVGVGVLPGPIRVPSGIVRPLLGPESYVGAKIATSSSRVGERSLRALGAVPVESAFEGADMTAFDGLELHAAGVAGNQYDGVVRWITTNVGLWPRPIAVLAGADRWAALSPTQRNWLTQAAHDAQAPTAALQSDPADVANLCRRHRLTSVEASADEVNRLRQAFLPVDRWLRKTATTAQHLDRIQELKTRMGLTVTGQPLDCPRAADPGSAEPSGSDDPGQPDAPDAANRSRSGIDGNYTVSFTADEVHAAGADPDPHPVAENWGQFRLALDRQRFAFTQHNEEACTWGYGTFTFADDILTLALVGGGGQAPNGAVNQPGELFSYRVTGYRGSSRWSAVPGAESPAGWTFKPWRQQPAQPWVRFLDARCPPPSSWDR